VKRITLRPATIVLLFLGLFSGCSTNQRPAGNGDEHASRSAYMPVGDAAASSTLPVEYLIQPNDELSIKFFYNPELNEDVVVRPDGKISLQLVDEVQAGGKTPTELDKELTKLYSVELRKPAVTVIVRSFGGQQIFVGGEVGKPQAIALTPQMTPLQAIMNAGGFLDTADQTNVMVIRASANNQAQTYAVNLDELTESSSPYVHFQLHPGDVIYIPKTGIAKADVWMDQHIRRFLLFNGFSAGYSIRH